MARFSGRVTAPKEGSRRRLPAEQRAQAVARGDAVGIGIGLEQDRDLLAVLEQLAELHHPAQVLEVVELALDVVADQRAQPRVAQARVGRHLLGRDAIRHQQHRRGRQGVGNRREGGAREGRLLRHDDEVVALLGIELEDRLAREAPRERTEARGPGAGLLLVLGHPGQLFGFAGADPRPEARELGAVAEDEAASQPHLVDEI
jgi:hypothetical protein